MAGKGGKRPGAGRKPKRDKHATAIDSAERLIRDRLPELVDLAFTRARGVMVKDVTLDGTVEYYETPPDLKAITYLMDRVMGKPTERQVVTGPNGGPVQVNVTKLTDEELRAIVEGKGSGGT